MLLENRIKQHEGTFNQVIEFFKIALTEQYKEKQNNPYEYYGHNFNHCFRDIEVDLRDSLYVALCLYLKNAVKTESNGWVYVHLEFLKTWESELKRPPHFGQNIYLLWNLYYLLKRLIAQNAPHE